MRDFSLTAKQEEANRILAGPATHVMLFGGSRSGKTFLIVRAMLIRAMKAPRSRHAILRFRYNAVKASIIHDTFPTVVETCFPGLSVQMNRQDGFAELPNGAQIWFGGLDDKDRAEKILGNEYASIFLNECSQIPWGSRNLALTRLAQSVTQIVDGVEAPLPLRMYYDCNPPDEGHWSFRFFVRRTDPETRLPLRNPDDVAAFQINPQDNQANLPAGYLDTLRGMSARMQRRFLLGEFREANPNALFPQEHIDKWRVLDRALPDLQRVVIAVDPSGSDDADNADSDAIGIVVAGLGTDGIAYILEDLTCKVGPAAWGRIVATAYDRHEADIVVAEINFGGAMVKHVLQTARPRTPFKELRASRGKAVRAEPVSSLVEQGQVRMVGYFNELEDELSGFTTSGYVGELSPNRADAFVWAVSELFPRLVLPIKPTVLQPRQFIRGGAEWMAM